VDLSVLFAPLQAFARKKRAKWFGEKNGIIFCPFCRRYTCIGADGVHRSRWTSCNL
jgi:hypothetical protein